MLYVKATMFVSTALTSIAIALSQISQVCPGEHWQIMRCELTFCNFRSLPMVVS